MLDPATCPRRPVEDWTLPSRIHRGLLGAIVLGACACSAQRQSAITPTIAFVPGTDGPPRAAYLPGTEFHLEVSWTAWCTQEGLIPETSTTRTCDEQPFVARVSCAGAPCDVTPGEVLTGGAIMRGVGEIVVRVPAPGDLRLDVAIEHVGTHETASRHGVVPVRALDEVVVDCKVQLQDASDPPRCTPQRGYVVCRDIAL